MSDELMLETALSSSVLYQAFNGNAEMTKTILKAIQNSTIITKEYIEEQILQIKRTNISPLAEEVLRAYEDGDITILYSSIKKVPQTIPFFATKMHGKIKVFIFVNNYGTVSKAKNGSSEKFLNISMKDLYVLMEGALVAYHLAMYPQKASKSLAMMKITTNIYTNMIIRIMNKEYAISMDQDLYGKVSFCLGKFFLTKVWNYHNDNVVFSYAKSSTSTPVPSTELVIINKLYDDANIETIEDLIRFMASFSPRLKTLNFRYFVQCFINTYKASTLFGLECLPYFLFTIESTMIGSFIVNQPIISDITKNIKGMNVFYPELVKIVG